MRLLAVLLFLWAVLRCVNAALSGPYPIGAVVGVFVFLTFIFILFYISIQNGSKIARYLLTAWAGYATVVQLLVVAARSEQFFRRFAEGLVCAAIMAIVNVPPISTLQRQIVKSQPRPVADDHEHDWRPDDLLNDWVRCAMCGAMHIEAGTIALINRKTEKNTPP